ncbi:flagellar hook-associated protein FlgK [Vibrio panuliri]|uniref:Flagellar hook-associated protein 1 n=1 Tax=Vibrio panuliri TaxID=1381081 RepID=A0ABX3FPA7_9VIBR|nr:flagellar hook-associated protein FlgK [Vibrio panuliri]KAB1453743.1 flagellar hook-associated protein FlgK [Vibrio panuliri]OLQ96080.1 flagellar hook-associated protein FlgK [Vibrio panuliri]
MASDLLGLGTQSVLTAQRQLNTTGHNISNVNTEGYSRQSVIQGTSDPRQFGGQTYGMGVHVENVRRSWDQFAVNELNLSTTNFAKRRDSEEDLEMLSGLLSSVSSKKIPENMNSWFDAVKSLADSPNDVGSRKVVLEKAGLIAQNLNDFYEDVRRQHDVVNKKLELGVERINQIGTEIRDIHRLMMRTPGPHNDLMDTHEKLVAELSEYTKVTVTPRSNREGFNVHIGNGHTLVSGTEASQLALVDGFPDVHQRRLAMIEGEGIKPITSKDMDGKIGAMLDMRDEKIPDVLDELGKMTIGYVNAVNYLQSQGLDLNGKVGDNLFTDINSQVAAKSRVVTASNSQADLAVYIENVTPLKAGEYSLQYDGSDYYVTRPDGERSAVAVKDNAISVDGLRIEINQGLASGERVLIRPTRSGAGQIQLATTDATKIAAQSYEASTTFAQGTASFDIQQAGDLKEFEVIISPDGTQFAVTDKNGKVLQQPQPYPPKGEVTVQGTSFTLSKGALPNDKFTANLVPSDGGNGNLRKMLYLQTDKHLNGGQSSIIDIYHDLNTDVGLKLSTASKLTDVSRIEKESAEERIASISGVNLDEEAANMMKFQQAYMASSRVMQAANETFDTILALR